MDDINFNMKSLPVRVSLSLSLSHSLSVSDVKYLLNFESPANGKDYVTESGVNELFSRMSSCFWIKTRSSGCWFFSYITEEIQSVLAFGYDSNLYYSIQVNSTLVRRYVELCRMHEVQN